MIVGSGMCRQLEGNHTSTPYSPHQYHYCHPNPIELVWASVKGYVARHNKDYNDGLRLEGS